MAERFVFEKMDHARSVDFVLLAIMLLLAGIGVSALFSASYYYGEYQFGDSFYFLRNDLHYSVIGVLCAVGAAFVPLRLLRKYIPLFVLFSLVLVLLPFVPGVGQTILGARRWIVLMGMSFQPSEAVKLVLVLYLAHIFEKKSERLGGDPVNSVLPPFFVTLLFVLIVYAQNDFSTAFFILFVAIAMFFVSGVNLGYFIFLATAVIPLGLIMIFTKPHRVQRIIAFLQPEIDPEGTGYQVLAAKDALMQGGFFGVGIGMGTEKIGGLPEAHSDFVFAVLGEEAGLIGVVAILVLFAAFGLRGYMVALNSGERFKFLLAFGITTSILYQALFNIAVVSGLVPATGIPLPFFSSGGSAKILTFLMCGLLLNVSRKTGEGAT